MNALTQHEPLSLTAVSGNAQTMSSVEIAERTGRRHQDVLRDIRNMLEQLGQPFAQYCAKVPSQGGRPMTVANLPKRESLILVSGYSVELRARIIDRWEELERRERPALPDLNNPATLRLLLADYANDKLALEEQVAELAPKADALDRIATADGSMCITDAAKTLIPGPDQVDNDWHDTAALSVINSILNGGLT